MRQGNAKFPALKPGGDLRVGVVGLVDEQTGVAADVRRVERDGVIAAMLVVQKHRQLAEIDMPRLEVVFPRDGAQVEDLEVLRQRQDDLVDVGKLVAGGVYLVEVGVAFQYPGRGVDRAGGLPRGHSWQVRVEGPVVDVPHETGPIVVPGVLHQLVNRVLPDIPGMELLQIVLGRKAAVQAASLEAVAAQRRRACQHVREYVVGFGEHEPDGMVVHFFHAARLVVDRHDGGLHRHQLVVPVDVFVPEHEVVSGEGMAVGPLHAAAQENGEDASSIRNLPSSGDVRHQAVAGRVPEQDLVVPATAVAVPEVGRSAEAAPPDTAVPADLVHRLDHQGIGADAFRHRRQLASLNPFRQRRRLLKLFRKLLPVRDHPRPFQPAHQRITALRPRLTRASGGQRQGNQRQGEADEDAAPPPGGSYVRHNVGSFPKAGTRSDASTRGQLTIGLLERSFSVILSRYSQ